MPPKRPGSVLSSNPHSVKRQQRTARLNPEQMAIQRAVKADNSYKLYHTARFKATAAYQEETDEGRREKLLEAYIREKMEER